MLRLLSVILVSGFVTACGSQSGSSVQGGQESPQLQSQTDSKLNLDKWKQAIFSVDAVFLDSGLAKKVELSDARNLIYAEYAAARARSQNNVHTKLCKAEVSKLANDAVSEAKEVEEALLAEDFAKVVVSKRVENLEALAQCLAKEKASLKSTK